MARLKRRTNVARLRGLAAGGVLLTTLLTLVVSAMSGAAWLYAVTALVCFAAELYLHRKEPRLMRRLGQLRAGVTIRALLRTALLVLLLDRTALVSRTTVHQFTVLALLLISAQAGFSAMTAVIRRYRTLPVSSRNIELGRMRITDTPPRLLTGWPGQRLIYHELVVAIGLLVALVTAWPALILGSLALSMGVSALTLLALVPHLVHALRFPSTARVLNRVNIWLRRYQPEAILYFSGSRSSAYQANMWLRTMSELNVPAMILLRESHLMRSLDHTDVPVLCVPDAAHLMNLDLASVRVAFYPSNVGKNIHLLRDPRIQHVFIGHGDSDKTASVNPYSKVYDQVWVAGPAGRDRYRAAGVGVRDEAVVEVGRPQLDSLRPLSGPAHSAIATVLYAPTWEGWTDDPGNTSLILAGEPIIKALLKAPAPVRIVYKPHPFTGTRSAAAWQADARIKQLLARANADAADHQLTQRELARRARAEERLADLTRESDATAALLVPPHHDLAHLSRDRGMPQPQLVRRLEELRGLWEQTYWDSRAVTEHLVIEGPSPRLYSCFDHCDLLISDISSVVSDFVHTLKPFALTNTTDAGDEAFRLQNTAARAAYLLAPDAGGVRGLLSMLGSPEQDTLAPARHALRDYLLGPARPSATERFNGAYHAITAHTRTAHFFHSVALVTLTNPERH